jgi:hypothetical protein
MVGREIRSLSPECRALGDSTPNVPSELLVREYVAWPVTEFGREWKRPGLEEWESTSKGIEFLASMLRRTVRRIRGEDGGSAESLSELVKLDAEVIWESS